MDWDVGEEEKQWDPGDDLKLWNVCVLKHRTLSY